MSFTPEQILSIQQALASRCEAVTDVDYVIPSPLAFSEKADFWNVMKTVDPHLTQKKIETSLIRAIWIKYLTFVSDDPANHAPLYTLSFEILIAHEYKYEKFDNADAFKIRILKNNQQHLHAIFSAVAEFEGEINITGFESEFDVLKTTGLIQQDFTQGVGDFEYVGDAAGWQTRLLCQVKARNKC